MTSRMSEAELASLREDARAVRDHPGYKLSFAEKDRERLIVEIDAARALLTRAATTIRKHLEALPKCDRSDLGCQRPATRAYRRGEGRWCDEHGYDPHGSPPEYPRAKTVRELTALLADLEAAK